MVVTRRCIWLALCVALSLARDATGAPVPTPEEVRGGLAALASAFGARRSWSYDATVSQRVTVGRGAPTTTLARCLYAQDEDRGAAIQFEWRDGVERALLSTGQLKSGNGIGPQTYVTQLLSDEDRLLSYRVYAGTPSETSSEVPIERSVTLFEGESTYVVPRNTDLPYLLSRPLLGYCSGTTESLIDLVLGADPDTTVVRSTIESVGGARCIVVDARTRQGTITLWLDPALQWQMRRAVVARGPTDQFANRLLWEVYGDRDVRRTETYEWNGFQLLEGVHRPTSYKFSAFTQLRSKPSIREIEAGTCALSEEATTSGFDIWSTSHIPDGTDCVVFSTGNDEADALAYVWDGDSIHRLIDGERARDVSREVAAVVPRRNEVALAWTLAWYMGLSLAGLVAIWFAWRRVAVRRTRSTNSTP